MRIIFNKGIEQLDIWQAGEFGASLSDTVTVNGVDYIILRKKWYMGQVPCSTMKELVCEVEVI